MSFLKKYEYVIAVEKYGSISQAAQALDIAQPTLSKYLKKTEIELGVELFDRSANPIRLTAAGELFVQTGKRMLDLDRQFQKQLDEIKYNKNSVVRVGISPSRSPYMMPAIIEAYRKSNPKGRLVIEERTTKELSDRLLKGDLDLIVSLKNEDTDVFEAIDLFQETILLAVVEKNPVSGASLADILQSYPLISVGKGQAMWVTLQDIAKKIGVREPDIECQSIESALALVKRGLGVMIVPSYIRDFGTYEQNKNVTFVPLAQIAPSFVTSHTRTVALCYRKEQFLSQAEKTFIACVQTALPKEIKIN